MLLERCKNRKRAGTIKEQKNLCDLRDLCVRLASCDFVHHENIGSCFDGFPPLRLRFAIER